MSDCEKEAEILVLRHQITVLERQLGSASDNCPNRQCTLNYLARVDQLTGKDPRFIGPYRLIARLGAGGMGLVYLGRSEQGRTVAVKVVQAEYAGHPEFRRRFAREVAAARLVGGSWTAAVLDADPEADIPWVATQYIPGPDLQTVVAKDFGPLPEDSVRILGNRLALALQAVHGAGLIHRDLKPSNVLVTVDGPRVIDFGIARAMDGLLGDSLHTHTGMLIGSPGFMSPEQVRGLELTPASDVFCLGAVLLYAATGRLLFGAGESGLNAHLFRIAEEEADLTGVPESLAELVGACLHKAPAERPTLQHVVEQTTTDRATEWLPSPVLAQLGRHAAELLDYVPAPTQAPVAQPTPVAPSPASASAPPQPQSPAYTPTAPAGWAGPAGATPPGFGPPQGFGPPPGFGQPPGPGQGAWAASPLFAPAPQDSTPADQMPAHRGRWWGLIAVVLAQLLVGLQVGTFNIALPLIQMDLHISNAERSTLVNSYTLAFVALVVLGGQVADLLGRRATMVIGLAVFAVASLLGGSAPNAALLMLARGLQGASGALVTVAAFALVAVNFTDPRERRTAFGLYAAVAGGGSVLGMFVGGWFAQLMSWRLALYADVPVAVIALVGALTLLHEAPRGAVARFDVVGVLLGTCGTVAVTFGFTRAGTNGWSDIGTVILLVVGAPVFAGFLWWRSRNEPAFSPGVTPSVAPGVATDRNRLGSAVAMVLTGAGVFALLTSLSLAAQSALGYSPAAVGEAFLPMALALLLGATLISARLAGRLPARVLIAAGLVTAAIGLALLTDVSLTADYTTQILPGLVLTGLGVGVALMPLLATATSGVAPSHTGAASSTVSAALQLGAGAGSALFVTGLLHLSGTSLQLTELRATILHDYTTTLWWAAALTLLAAIAAGLLITARPEDPAPSR
ncbi:serine/threonine protein kinase/MFS family permease [Streptacidiphilus sp. BW17]